MYMNHTIPVADELGMYDESEAYEADIQALRLQYMRRVTQSTNERTKDRR